MSLKQLHIIEVLFKSCVKIDLYKLTVHVGYNFYLCIKTFFFYTAYSLKVNGGLNPIMHWARGQQSHSHQPAVSVYLTLFS